MLAARLFGSDGFLERLGITEWYSSLRQLARGDRMKKEPDKNKIQEAINQARADLNDLADCVPRWVSTATSSGREYRAIAERIVASAQRIRALVRENTYSPN
jgi:hypothetical protein